MPLAPRREISTVTRSRIELADAVEGGGRAVGLATDEEVGLGVDEVRDAVAEERVIVHDEDAVFCVRRRSCPRGRAGVEHVFVGCGVGFHFRGRMQRTRAP